MKRDEQAERARLAAMSVFENEYRDGGLRLIAGVDEAGRGPLCGPVTAACVVFGGDVFIPYLNDSKKLSEKRREALYGEIIAKAAAWAVCDISHDVIDEINILEATKLAMRGAVEGLSVKPDVILADALTIPGVSVPQEAIIGGDRKSVSIAAASIIAKVHRDALMRGLAEKYPGYGLERNKGYGTAEHIRAIRGRGLSEIHRRSFCGKFV